MVTFDKSIVRLLKDLMIIGITGQIGSGKSTAARVFKKLGAVIIDADRIGREVVESNPNLVRRISRAFGPDTVDRRGKLNRARVAQIAFASKQNKRKLDKLVHPFLLKKLQAEIKKVRGNNRLIVIDAALLLDWHLDKIVDKVLVVHASLENRIRRLKGRGINRRDALARQKMQPSYSEFKRRADKVILNNSNKSAFENKVRGWAKSLIS